MATKRGDAVKVASAKVTLTWEDGRTVEIGTLDIEAEKKGYKSNMRFMQRLGWELVRKGFWIMFPWRKWKMNQSQI